MTCSHPPVVLTAIDPTDVPRVTARELALAVKLLQELGKSLEDAADLTDDDVRRVEAAFWHHLKRHRLRKTAVLLRFRCLVQVCRARRVADLMSDHGRDAMNGILAAAAGLRLNAAWGFSPLKLARAAMVAIEPAPQGA